LARRHAWPLLSAGSYVCTCALVIAWFFSSYTTGQWLRTELFLTLFVTLFGYLLWTLLVTRSWALQAQLSVAALTTAPLAYHLASLILLNPHPAAWLVYLVAFTVAGLVIAQRSRTPWVRVAVLLLAGLPNLAWLQALPDRGWYAAAVVSVFVLYGLHLAAQWESTSDDAAQGEIPLLEVVHTQLNGLWLPVSLYVFLDTRYAWLAPWMVAALSSWNGALAGVARRLAPRTTLQFVALSATLAAVALVLAFDGPAVAVGWAAEGVVLGWLAVRERSRRIGIGSGLLIGLGSTQLALLLAASPVASDVPIFNSRTLAAALIVALLSWLAWRIRDDPAVTVRGQARTAVIIAANLLCLALVSAEIHAFFSGRGADSAIAGAPTSAAAADLAEQVTLSVVWAMYAVALIAAGIRRRYAPARYLAIALFGVTVAKVLLNDIAGLDRLHRMLSVLGVGVLLVLASYLYQRMAADTTVPH
ncbi:MAG: DUF2339 domain-containing protein, partial [Acidobacteria bacterium]|nr:DUF2339 domain-containing protein [Acidobacteriota bacterium]